MELVTLLQVFVAALLGGLIGIERGGESHSPAGLRTNMIIAMSSCLFTILSVQVMMQSGEAPGEHGTMLAHIISGVGFLGAGAIFRYDGGKTGGMTTAATIWLVAGIGMTVGMGYYFLGIFITGFSLCVLHFLEPFSEWLQETEDERHKTAALRRRRKAARA